MQRLVILVGAAITLLVAGCTYERKETVAAPPAAVVVPPATIVTVP